MPPVSRERVDQIFENYLLALAGVDQCSESAPDDVRSRLAANADKAEQAYTDATADGRRACRSRARHGVCFRGAESSRLVAALAVYFENTMQAGLPTRTRRRLGVRPPSRPTR